VKIVVLAVPIARLSRGEDLVASVHRARVHLSRVNGLDVLFEDEVVAERPLAEVARRQRRRALDVLAGVAVLLTIRRRRRLRRSVVVVALHGISRRRRLADAARIR